MRAGNCTFTIRYKFKYRVVMARGGPYVVDIGMYVPIYTYRIEAMVL